MKSQAFQSLENNLYINRSNIKTAKEKASYWYGVLCALVDHDKIELAKEITSFMGVTQINAMRD